MRRMTVTVNDIPRAKNNTTRNNFTVTIKDGDETVFNQSYRSRNNVSYDKGRADDWTPYVTDLLCQLKEQYNVDRLALEPGEGCLGNRKGHYKDLLKFDEKYCMANDELAAIKEEPSVKSFVAIEGNPECGTFDISVMDAETSEDATRIARYRSWYDFDKILNSFTETVPISGVSTRVDSFYEEPPFAMLKTGINVDEFCGELCRGALPYMVFPNESDEHPDVKMTVYVDGDTFGSLNSDNEIGFSVGLTADGKVVLDNLSAFYSYGRNTSNDRENASEYKPWQPSDSYVYKPYVTDVLQGTIDKYHVSEFTVKRGYVSEECVENFKSKYCKDLSLHEPKQAETNAFLTEDDLNDLEKLAANNGLQA